MAAYRLYILSAQERISDSLEAVFADDREAMDYAEALRRNRHAAEVWRGPRLIARLGAEFCVA